MGRRACPQRRDGDGRADRGDPRPGQRPLRLRCARRRDQRGAARAPRRQGTWRAASRYRERHLHQQWPCAGWLAPGRGGARRPGLPRHLLRPAPGRRRHPVRCALQLRPLDGGRLRRPRDARRLGVGDGDGVASRRAARDPRGSGGRSDRVALPADRLDPTRGERQPRHLGGWAARHRPRRRGEPPARVRGARQQRCRARAPLDHRHGEHPPPPGGRRRRDRPWRRRDAHGLREVGRGDAGPQQQRRHRRRLRLRAGGPRPVAVLRRRSPSTPERATTPR